LNIIPVYTKLIIRCVKKLYKIMPMLFYLVGSHTSLKKAHIHIATETNVVLQYTCVNVSQFIYTFSYPPVSLAHRGARTFTRFMKYCVSCWLEFKRKCLLCILVSWS